jgi:hypothetical protein
VAERLRRRWLACDASSRAIHTTTKRLLDTPGCAPFEVWSAAVHQQRDAQAEIDFQLRGGALRVELRDYQADVPDDLRPRVHSFTDLVDYWEIGSGDCSGALCSRWQSFRSKAHELVSHAEIPVDGDLPERVAVRVVDVLGHVTTWIRR